jgi:hypothetical protein
MGTAAVSHVDTATDLEGRAGVESLERLQTLRREKIKEFAPLAAKFRGGSGQGSSSDAARKRHRALIAQKILVELKQEFERGPKTIPSKKTNGLMVPAVFEQPSETALERMANAHVDHIAFCNQLEKDFTRYVVLENEIDELNERIRSREVELRCYNAEINLR